MFVPYQGRAAKYTAMQQSQTPSRSPAIARLGQGAGVIVALLLAWPCQAEPAAGEIQGEPATAAAPGFSVLSSYPHRFTLTASPWPEDARYLATRPVDDGWADPPMSPRPYFLLRLRDLDGIPLVTLWEGAAASVFIGVDEDGHPGIHLRQKEDE